MNYFKFILSTCVVGLLVSSTFSLTRTQVKDADVPDLVEQKVGPLVLNNEYFVEGLARLNMQTNGIGFAVEFLPGTTTSAPPPDLRFTTENEAGTVKHALDWLCSLDPRYTWKLEGRTINIIPRDRVSDPNYLFNRKLSGLSFVELRAADDSLDKIFKPVAKTGESVITLSDAGSFSKP